MVFKLEIADIVRGRVDINNLRFRDGNVYVKKADGEAYDENRKGNVVENVKHIVCRSVL